MLLTLRQVIFVGTYSLFYLVVTICTIKKMIEGGSPEITALDNELITKMIQTPFDGTTNPIFVALFNSLGIIPAVYASLLLPGKKNQ